MKTLFIILCAFLEALDSVSAVQVEVFRTNFSQNSLSEAFGGVQVSYGSQNVFLWGNGEGIDVIYPEGRYWSMDIRFRKKAKEHFYNSPSYTPSAEPVGGFGVWTRHTINRTAIFKYGVTFPVGFDFVKGGKLPGLYGGKTSCTGGDPAVDCFSTRLMWREGGQGELYLYANRDAQDSSICESPTNM